MAGMKEEEVIRVSKENASGARRKYLCKSSQLNPVMSGMVGGGEQKDVLRCSSTTRTRLRGEMRKSSKIKVLDGIFPVIRVAY